MKAEEARKKTRESVLTNTNSMLGQVYEKINKTCQEGKFFCNIENLHHLVVEKLIEDGFIVKFYPRDYRGETNSYYKISWE